MRKLIIVLAILTTTFLEAQGGIIGTIASSVTSGAGGGRKQSIIVDNTKVSGSVNLTNYPMLITLDYLDAEIVDAGSNSALNGGGDLRFYSDASLTTRLSCEVVTFVTNATEGSRECIVWVKVPTVTYSSDTTIYVSYNQGETAQPAVGAAYGRNSVWTDYELVSHDGYSTDSSGNLTGVVDGTPTYDRDNAYGGKSYHYNEANEDTSFAYSGNMSGGAILQCSGYQTTGSTGVAVAVWTGNQWMRWQTTATNDVDPGYNTGTNHTSIAGISYDNVSPNLVLNWHKFDFYVSGFTTTNLETWVDGSDAGNTTGSSKDFVAGTPNNEICIGQLNTIFTGQNVYAGSISDVRLRLGALTLDWCITEKENQYNASTFASAGTPTDI